MCCEQQETRKPEGQPDPPLFTVLSAEVSISCTLPVNIKRSISQICRPEELFPIMKHFVCTSNQCLLLMIKKQTKKTKQKTLDMTADWTAHHLSLSDLSVLKMFPLNRSCFTSLAEMKI